MQLVPSGAPRLVVTAGVYRSASTWVSNVVAEILRLADPTRIVVADSVAELARQSALGCGIFVIKTHRPDASLRLLIQTARLPVIVSVRDPIDCVASLTERFKEPFQNAMDSVVASCNATLRLLSFCDPLILRYEAPKARDARRVAQIAERVGVSIEDETAEAIADRFAPQEVKRLIENYTARGIFGRDPQPHYAHIETQWHPGHLGSGESGVGRRMLTLAQIALVETATSDFCDRFRYAAKEPGLSKAG